MTISMTAVALASARAAVAFGRSKPSGARSVTPLRRTSKYCGAWGFPTEAGSRIAPTLEFGLQLHSLLKASAKRKAPPVRTTDGSLLPSNGGRLGTSAPSYKRALLANGSANERTLLNGEAGSTSMLNEGVRCGVSRTPVNSGRRPPHHEPE